MSKDEQNGALHLASRKIKFSASAICSPLVVSALAFSCAQDVAPIAAISVATRLVVALDNNCNNSEFMRQFAPSVSASLAQVSGGLPLQPQNKSHFHPAVIALLFPLERTSCVPSELRAPRLFCRCAVCPAWHFLLLLYFAFFFYFPAFFSCFSLLHGIFGAPQTVWLHKDEESSLLGVVCACFAAHSQQNTKLQLAKRLRCALIGWRRGKCARIIFS